MMPSPWNWHRRAYTAVSTQSRTACRLAIDEHKESAMGKIQDLYSTRVRPMLPAERLQLARLILDDLAPTEQPVDISEEWTDDDLADAAAASARQADRSSTGNGTRNESR